jgi:dihydroorotate dehydrogenase (NAD+) catalytic subunit
MSKNQTDLSTNIGKLKLKNPLIAASGTFGYGSEFEEFGSPDSFGGICVKGLSLEPKSGNPMPRIIETPSGMLNAIGLENVGVKEFAAKKMPYLRGLDDTKIIANFFGNSIDEYVRCASEITNIPGVHALEMNISCPNVKAGGIAFGTDPNSASEVVSAVRAATDLPLIVKLSPNVTDIRVIGRAVEEAGADALSLINTVTGLAVDLERRRPVLANVTGGLSGPAIKPLALRMVWEMASVARVPIIGLGGIMSGRDALEFICIGASAVQIGTANFVNPSSVLDILTDMEQYLADHNIEQLSDFVGTFQTK